MREDTKNNSFEELEQLAENFPSDVTDAAIAKAFLRKLEVHPETAHLFTRFEFQRALADRYIYDTDLTEPIDPDYAAAKRAKEIVELYRRLHAYFKRVQQGLAVNVEYQWPKWTWLRPRRGERRRRNTTALRRVYALAWQNSLTYQKTKQLYEKKPDLPLHPKKDHHHYLVITVVDTKEWAKVLELSERQVREYVRRWCSGPLVQVGYEPKRGKGRPLVALGYWMAGVRRVPFFTKKEWLSWWREQLFTRR